MATGVRALILQHQVLVRRAVQFHLTDWFNE